jgi:hypothetical protein
MFHVVAATGSAPCQSQLATPLEVILFSYWSIKPWFLTERKRIVVLITPSSWDSPTR